MHEFQLQFPMAHGKYLKKFFPFSDCIQIFNITPFINLCFLIFTSIERTNFMYFISTDAFGNVREFREKGMYIY